MYQIVRLFDHIYRHKMQGRYECWPIHCDDGVTSAHLFCFFIYTHIQRRRGLGPSHRKLRTRRNKRQVISLLARYILPHIISLTHISVPSCDTTIKNIPKPSPKACIQVQMPIMVCKCCAAYAVCQSCHAKDGSESNQELKARGQGEELLRKGPTRQQRKKAAPTSSNSGIQESCNHRDKSTFRDEFDDVYWRLKWRSLAKNKIHVNLYCGTCKCDFSW